MICAEALDRDGGGQDGGLGSKKFNQGNNSKDGALFHRVMCMPRQREAREDCWKREIQSRMVRV